MVWTYTPRKIHALIFIGTKRQEREDYLELSKQFLASQGDPKEVKRRLQTMFRSLD